MSKAMRGALAILLFLLILCVGVAVYALIQRQSLDQQNQTLQAQIADEQTKQSQLLARAKKLEKDQQELNDKLSQKDREKQQLQREFDEVKSKSEDLTSQISQLNQQLNQERDDSKSRMETIRKERDELMQKLKDRPVKVVYKDRPASAGGTPSMSLPSVSQPAAATPPSATIQNDQYWGQILKEKAALQLDLQKVKADMDQNAVQVVELKKQNADLQLEFKNLNDAKLESERRMQQNQQEFERKLKYSEDLSNAISVEVARARDDQKNSNERSERLKQENLELQGQIKQLTTTKLALEKTIAQINVDKTTMQKKLAETEGMIQGRINEIWQIKDNLDSKISQLPKPGSAEVELPPIIVNANGSLPPPEIPAAAVAVPAAGTPVKSQGTIISINEPNNFAIIDLGESDGSQVGRKLTVLRDNNTIGNLEIIQVRKDISAADIKQNTMKLKVGDIVRY